MFEPPNLLALDPDTLASLANAAHGNPFAILGPRETPRGRMIRAWLPGARRVEVLSQNGIVIAALDDRQMPGLFAGFAGGAGLYRLRVEWPEAVTIAEDPYAFGPLLGDTDLHLIAEGKHRRVDQCLGAHVMTIAGVSGVRFAVWAPNARRVAIIGDFNSWDKRRHAMRLRHEAGVWELFVPGLGENERYKFAVSGCDGVLREKADPFARRTEIPPATASITSSPLVHEWRDGEWLTSRRARQARDEPLSIYEVHPGSWMKHDGASADWQSAIDQLIPYVASLGFTHVELLPIAEHPFAGSWGYQPLSHFAPTARYGKREDFARFVDACHNANIGVILDWVPAHFPDDAHGLVCFDGTGLYEHADPLMKRHPDWNTFVFNHGRYEVRNYLFASALHWLEEFHVDGLRVDAVASMLYRDYSRAPGQWSPNADGGRENLESVAFLKDLNTLVAARCPGALMIAEESTSWPHVTGAIKDGGLGFSLKWNMGWMNDTLRYMARDPIHRQWHHEEITFGMMYAYSEHFVLPLSHDEVVHEKCSLLGKMSGDEWQKRANLRAYYAFMWTMPGKKLLFMGGEFGQKREWDHDSTLDWDLLNDAGHAGLQSLVRDLNRIYRHERALAETDGDPDGFRWIAVDDREHSVFVFARHAPGAATLIIAVNMTPLRRDNYRIGVPHDGFWHEILNSDAVTYGGIGDGNGGGVYSEPAGSHDEEHSIELTLPALSAIVLRHEPV